LERVGFAGYDEGDGFDPGIRGRYDDFVAPGDFTFRNIERAARKEAHSSLRVTGLVLAERMESIRFILVVPNVSISAKGQMRTEDISEGRQR